MKTSLIVTCGYIKHEDPAKIQLENERIKALAACLINLSTLDFSMGDEVIVVEYGEQSRLEDLIRQNLRGAPGRHVFIPGKGFNQSIAKNAGAAASNNEILCWINSDVIVQNNIFDVLRKRFERNPRIFATAARHDVFFDRSNLIQFIHAINQPENYRPYPTALIDAGWHHALKSPQTPIPTTINAFVHGGWRLVHDFQMGYINYGELMAVTKEVWEKYPFDEDITAIVDSYIRDIIFANEENFGLELIHDETAVFHMSGSDFMGQQQVGSDKYVRLIADMRTAAEKYECMRHWLVFSYFKEFDDLILKYNIPFKEILEKWRTPLMWQFFRDKEHVKELYGVEDAH